MPALGRTQRTNSSLDMVNLVVAQNRSAAHSQDQTAVLDGAEVPRRKRAAGLRLKPEEALVAGEVGAFRRSTRVL